MLEHENIKLLENGDPTNSESEKVLAVKYWKKNREVRHGSIHRQELGMFFSAVLIVPGICLVLYV